MREEENDSLDEKVLAASVLLGLKSPDIGLSGEGGKSKKLQDLPISQIESAKKTIGASDYSPKAPVEYIGDRKNAPAGYARKPGIDWKSSNPEKTMPDTMLNSRSKEGRKQIRRLKSNPISRLNHNTGKFEVDDIATQRMKNQYKDSYIRAEAELDRRGFEKVPKKRFKEGNRPHHYKKGMKTLKALGPIGALIGLAASSDVEASDFIPILDTAETMGQDKAIEDPTSVEYQAEQNRRRLAKAIEARRK